MGILSYIGIFYLGLFTGIGVVAYELSVAKDVSFIDAYIVTLLQILSI